MKLIWIAVALCVSTSFGAVSAAAQAPVCDKLCLEKIAAEYRAAYLSHDPSRAPFAKTVRFTENNVEMKLPDGTWDTVAREIGPALTVSDPVTGNVGIFTSIQQQDIPGFLAIRLKIVNRKISEVEHVISTKRNLSAPPTPIGEVESFTHDPEIAQVVAPTERMSRKELVRLSDGYFSTLENNTGEIRGTRFSANATRFENGMKFPDIEKGFRLGRYRFNDRVRDRDYFLVDEVRGVVMSRAYIDHKGQITEFQLTDGTQTKPIFREPQSWGVIELFKIKAGEITAIEATFVQTPYYMRSPWTKHPETRQGGVTPPQSPPPTSNPAGTNPPVKD